MKIGDNVKYFNTHTKVTVTGKIMLINGDMVKRAIVKHTGQYKHYFDVEICCFALTII